MSNIFAKYYIRYSFVIGFFIYWILYIFQIDRVTLASLGSLFCFVTSGLIISHFCDINEEAYFSKGRLSLYIILYAILIVCTFWYISYYYEGDTYIFSKVDAFKYEKHSLKMASLPLKDAFKYISRVWRYGDWGAPFMMSTILRIIPSKVFLNFVYILFGSIGSIYLFCLGRFFMDKKWAFIMSFSFYSSSFALYFHGTFLKESFFMILVVGMIYHFYKFISTNFLLHIIIFLLYSISIIYFRAAVVFFFWAAILIHFLFSNKRKITSIIVIISAIIIMMLLSTYIIEEYNRYTLEGDYDRVRIYGFTNETIGFGYFVNWVSSLFGPFPSIISEKSHRVVLYSSGLLLKVFLSFPMWLGIFKAFKKKESFLYPIIFFTLIETFILGFLNKSFELRLGLPHYQAFFLISFWYLSQQKDITRLRIYDKFYMVFSIAIVIFWNILRTK